MMSYFEQQVEEMLRESESLSERASDFSKEFMRHTGKSLDIISKYERQLSRLHIGRPGKKLEGDAAAFNKSLGDLRKKLRDGMEQLALHNFSKELKDINKYLDNVGRKDKI